MRLLLTGGGTAGHVYPVLSVVEAVRAQQPDPHLVWVGSHSGIEGDIIRRAGIPFRGIGLRGGVRGVGPLAAVRGALGVVAGTMQALRVIRAERPDVIMATGGYVSVPAVLAGWLLRVPSLIYLPDMEPGWAVKFLAPMSRRIAVTTEDSRKFFAAKKVFVSGYPVRAAFFGQDRKAAREAFGLDPDLRTILVVGGSRGSHNINVALTGTLVHLLLGYQIIHISGQIDIGAMRQVRDDLPSELKRRYKPYGFLNDDMAKAYAAADLVVSRAGASVLGEIPAAGVAAILVPYAGGHRDQAQNAAFLAAQGAASVIDDAALSPTLLEEEINEITEPARLATMRQAAAAVARPDAASIIASELAVLARR
jgi:UDP-N-acetylglucosamine--N-acetylmuramyl-(pentapeptide) pyrophosphoryl-undecaprenol N-acetylglucosamine transferase